MLDLTAYPQIHTHTQEGRLTLVDLAGLDDTRKGATSQQPRTMDTSSVLPIAPRGLVRRGCGPSILTKPNQLNRHIIGAPNSSLSEP
jgi:hypothetical protein